MDGLCLGYILEHLCLNLILCIALFAVVSLAVNAAYAIVKRKKLIDSFQATLFCVVLLSYSLTFLYATLISRANGMTSGMIVIPFHTLVEQLPQGMNGWSLVLVSILVGVPFGLLLPCCLKNEKKWWVSLGLTALFGLFVEAVQLATGRGVFDLDDILLLSTGSLLGFWIYTRFSRSKVYRKLAVKN